MNGELDLSIIAPAFVAGLLVLATHVPLGAQVLQRGIVFIDLAIAQIAGLGVIAAGLLEVEPHGWTMQLAAGAAAMLGAFLLSAMEKRWPEVHEAQIGAVFVLAATGSLLLLARHPHGDEHLHDLLSGQILWLTSEQLLLPAVATLLIGLALRFFGNALGGLGFYLLFALAVTLSVQLVGVYLVFASLIIPSLGARRHPPARRLPLAFLCGVAAYALGLIVSLWSDLPAGALIVWFLAAMAVITHAMAPKAFDASGDQAG